jgi:hypothetical protein
MIKEIVLKCPSTEYGLSSSLLHQKQNIRYGENLPLK